MNRKTFLFVCLITCVSFIGLQAEAFEAIVHSEENPTLHKIEKIDRENKFLIMKDGSIWKATSTIPNWHEFQELELVVRSSYFTDYEVFKSTSKNQEVQVELATGPFFNHPQTELVLEIDIDESEIYSSNGRYGETRWVAHPLDAHEIKHWKVGQALIVGKNEKSWLPDWLEIFELVLFNVERNTIVRVCAYE